MFGKIVRSGKVSGAKGTGERFLSGVTALVFPEVLLSGEGEAAGGAGVRPLACVHAGMEAQLGRTREVLAANRAA
jgi:hypothetical protein